MSQDEFRSQQARLNVNLERMRCFNRRVAIVFEGRDSAGKTSGIREITKYAPNDICKVYDSEKPSKNAMKSWLQHWAKKMPGKGEVCFYDRSWYSRAIVQPLNGWCTKKQYRNFMKNVRSWERSQDVVFIKIWASITQEEQAHRLNLRKDCELRYWKFSENDKLSLTNYHKTSVMLADMMAQTRGWRIVDFNDKAEGRLESLKLINEILERT